LVAVFLNVPAAVRHPSARITVALVAPYLLVLLRGEARDYWIVPLLPALALNVGVAGALAWCWLRIGGRAIRPESGTLARGAHYLYPINRRLAGATVLGVLLAPAIFLAPSHSTVYMDQFTHLFHHDQTNAERAARVWIKANVAPGAVLVIDSYLWVELYEPRNASGLPRYQADYYWNVEKDPEIRETKLKGDWRNVDYLVVTPQLEYYTQQGTIPFVKTILDHSIPIAEFSSYGYWVRVQKVIKEPRASEAPTAPIRR
jgi:hypothetical protein